MCLGYFLCRFDVQQVFIQSNVKEDVFMRILKGYGSLSGTLLSIEQEPIRCEARVRSWYANLIACLMMLDVQHCLADACVFIW